MQKEKIIILFTVFVDVLGIGIVIPILPFYVQEFGAGPTMITLLFSVFSLFAFVSAPYLGALSDRIGRRPVLIGSILSTAAGWIVFAGAANIPMLFVGRILDGIAAGNISTAQSTLVDISRTEKERTANLGLIGAAFGIGFMVGPLIGALLSKVSHAFPFWFTGGLAITNAVITYIMLPETNTDRQTEGKLSVNPLAPLNRAIKDRGLRPLYFSWIMFMMAFVVAQSVFALFVEKAFAFDSFLTGMTFTAMGLIVALNQTVGLKYYWLRHFTEAQLEKMMFISILVGLVLIITGSLTAFLVSVLFIATGQSVLRVVITSQIAGQADPKTKGEKIGTLSSLMSACMALGPLIAGPLFDLHEILPYVAAALFIITGLIAVISFERTHLPASIQPEPDPPASS